MVLPSLFCAALLAFPPGFDPALFPDAASHSSAEIELAGMAQLYPGRVLHETPQASDPGNAGRLPLVADLPRNVTYMRIYDITASMPRLFELLLRPAVILDLRYVSADAAAAEAFAITLAKAGLASAPVHAVGNFKEPGQFPPLGPSENHRTPLVLALVNGQTSGPIEAWLAAFQDKESLLAVGVPTAGQPGVYRPVEGQPGYYVLTGELQPASGSVAGGGLKPRFPVDVTPEQNYRAYFDVEHGLEVTSLLRHDRVTAPAPPATSGNTTTQSQAPAALAEEETDPMLQRAVDVVAALQLLGRVPSSTATGASTAPAPRPAATSSSSNSPAQP